MSGTIIVGDCRDVLATMDAESVDAIVCDPFAGSGSTGIAAHREGFRFVGIELSPEYAEIARKRMAADAAVPRQLAMIVDPT